LDSNASVEALSWLLNAADNCLLGQTNCIVSFAWAKLFLPVASQRGGVPPSRSLRERSGLGFLKGGSFGFGI